MLEDIDFSTNYVINPGYSTKQQRNTVEYRFSKFPPCVDKVLQALLYKRCLFVFQIRKLFDVLCPQSVYTIFCSWEGEDISKEALSHHKALCCSTWPFSHEKDFRVKIAAKVGVKRWLCVTTQKILHFYCFLPKAARFLLGKFL